MFLSISLPLSRNLTPSLSYHIVRKRIAKVTDFLSFCPFGISIFPFLTIGISMYQKSILPHFIIPFTFSPQASSPFERSDRQDRMKDRENSSPPVMLLHIGALVALAELN
jgi:hypothetical protein